MPSTRKEKEREHRRELLLEAAARVFGRKPFDEASMQEVAAEAEIGMQGLYEHFASKQELYEQVILQRAIAFQAIARDILGRSAPPLDQLRQLAVAYIEFFDDQPWHLPTFARDRASFDWEVESRFSPRLREIYEQDRGHVRALVGEALERGDLAPADPEFVTQLCLDLLYTSLHYRRHHRPDESAADCVARALDTLLHGVGARP